MSTVLKIDEFDCRSAPCCRFTVSEPVIFDLDVELVASPPGQEPEHRHLGAAGIDVSWLPEGGYRLECPIDNGWPAGTELELILRDRGPDGLREQGRANGRLAVKPDFSAASRLGAAPDSAPVPGGLAAIEGTLVALLGTLTALTAGGALAVTTVYRLTSYWFVVALGGAAALWVIARV
jgi:hypothetical protein